MDSNHLKKRQHYVWREYLRGWATPDNPERVFCLRNGKEPFPANLMNLAQEKYFYQIEELSAEEIDFIKIFAINDQNPFIREIDMNWLSTYCAVFSYIRLFESLGYKDEQFSKLLTVNAGEEFQSKIEESASYLIDMLRNDDISFFSEEQGRIDFSLYITNQYFRTKNIKEKIKNTASKIQSIDFEKCWKVLRYIMASDLAYSIAIVHADYHMCLLKNDTSINFITGDQPVINSKVTEEELGKKISELDFYYPISPSRAILITKDSDKLGIIQVSEKDVLHFNHLIKVHSLEELFALNEKDFDA